MISPIDQELWLLAGVPILDRLAFLKDLQDTTGVRDYSNKIHERIRMMQDGRKVKQQRRKVKRGPKKTMGEAYGG